MEHLKNKYQEQCLSCKLASNSNLNKKVEKKIEIKKNINFHQHKTLMKYKLDLYGYFFQKVSAYRRDFDKTKYVFFDKRWLIIRKT